MNTEKVFVKSSNLATITCPRCNLIRNIPVGKFRHIKKPLKIRCKCNHLFAISLDFRQHFRKNVGLTGSYNLLPPASGGGRLHISNISRTGIGFTVTGTHSIEPGQKAQVEFTLSNTKKTKLNKKVEIVSVKANFIGCLFLDDQQFEKDLGFFLLP